MSEINPLLREEPMHDDTDRALRPKSLSEFIGQSEARSNLRVFIESARQRNDAMDHTLFFGPPGLGKTTLAQIISRELGVNFKMTSGPVLAKAGDLSAILTNLETNDVLFIDDDPDNIRDLNANLPGCKTIWVKRNPTAFHPYGFTKAHGEIMSLFGKKQDDQLETIQMENGLVILQKKVIKEGDDDNNATNKK